MQYDEELNGFPITAHKDDLSATMHINIQDYFDAYAKGVDVYRKFRAAFGASIGFKQVYFASSFLDAATSGCTQEERQIIENSPAWALTEDSIYELFKNAIDSIISLHNVDGKTNQIDLTLKIHVTAENIELTIQDNGIGFTPSFLNKVNSLEKQMAFMKVGGSQKLGLKKPDHELPDFPEYFGGVGHGLRALDKKVIDTPLVGGRVFNKPERSSIEFKNDEHARGAIIQVTTSLEPLVPLKEAVVLPKAFKEGLKSFIPSYLRPRNTPKASDFSPTSSKEPSPTASNLSVSSSDTNLDISDPSSPISVSMSSEPSDSAAEELINVQKKFKKALVIGKDKENSSESEEGASPKQ